jgi:hypothetical protein
MKDWVGNVVLAASALLLAAALFMNVGQRFHPIGSGGWVPSPLDSASVGALAVEFETLDGARRSISSAVTADMLIVYRTTCRYCGASRRHWARLIREVPALCSGRTVLISAEPIEVQKDYWAEWDWRLPDCNEPEVGRPSDLEGFRASSGVYAVPTHLILDDSGIASRAWVGAIASRKARRELGTAFERQPLG